MTNTPMKTLKFTPASQSFAEGAIDSNATDAALATARFNHEQRLLALSTDFAARRTQLQNQPISEVQAITNGEEHERIYRHR
jgi:hypothetical protein